MGVMSLGQRMRSMSMRSNLMVTAAIGLAVAVFVGVLAIVRMNDIADRADVIYRASLVPLSEVQDIEQMIWHARWASLSGTTTDDAARAKAYNDEAAGLFG